MLDIQGVPRTSPVIWTSKVGGTRKGITAIQMDIKIDGLTYDIIAEAFEKCRKGRLYILDEIIKPVIAQPREELSRWAPKMFSMMIPTDKIKDVIGKGGKVIQDIATCKIGVQGRPRLRLRRRSGGREGAPSSPSRPLWKTPRSVPPSTRAKSHPPDELRRVR